MEIVNSKPVYLTFDVDWLCDEYLVTTVDILKKYNLKATFFATHDSPLLHRLDSKQFEIGLHPNFDLGDGRYQIDALSKLKKMYPQAAGTRSHTLFFGSRLLPELEKCNMRYESNIYLHLHQGLHAVTRTQNIISIPFNWSDDKHIELGCDFDLEQLPDFSNPGLNVFNFHPVHVFLNTDTIDRYNSAKPFFNKNEMKKFINDGDGIRSLFEKVCQQIKVQSIQTGHMSDITL